MGHRHDAKQLELKKSLDFLNSVVDKYTTQKAWNQEVTIATKALYTFLEDYPDLADFRAWLYSQGYRIEVLCALEDRIISKANDFAAITFKRTATEINLLKNMLVTSTEENERLRTKNQILEERGLAEITEDEVTIRLENSLLRAENELLRARIESIERKLN